MSDEYFLMKIYDGGYHLRFTVEYFFDVLLVLVLHEKLFLPILSITICVLKSG